MDIAILRLAAMAALLVFLMALLAIMAWEMHTVGPPRPHAHHGPERSRHERNGKLVRVHQCRRCGIHFSIEED